ncbi:MAG: hypothetical protein MJZ00_01240 [Paludibacteraceae bacterium]|nr:hypothetical protein [Paludibacteraceae bacterium]
MKRLFLVLASMASIASTLAQDVIVKRDGEEIQCKILEVSTNKVKYKQWKNQSGPTFVEKKSDVLMLKYENGQKEVMNFTAPVGASQIEETVAEAPVDSIALADTMPISKNYLEYVRKEESGLLMWGRSISKEKAHEILGKDWTDFTRAHKKERTGRAMIFTGGALIVGGGVFTALHIKANNDYNDKKAAYENHVAEAEAGYLAKIDGMYKNSNDAETKRVLAENNRNEAKTAYDKAKQKHDENEKLFKLGDLAPNVMKTFREALDSASVVLSAAENSLSQAETEATESLNLYNNYIANGTANYNAEFYKSSFLSDMNKAKDFKNATLYPMIGCYASGAALLVWGIIKEKRAHKTINSIVNSQNATPEDEIDPATEIQQLESRLKKKPVFDLAQKENGLAFVLNF